MPNCKDCGKPLQEDFNVCPYCGFPTDKIWRELEEVPALSQEEAQREEEELKALAVSADQLTRGMENPEQERENREENGELAMPMPTVDGKEFGGPQSGPLQRQEQEYLEARAKEREARKGEGGELTPKEELKSFFNRRNVMMLLLGAVVIVCVVIIIFFSNVMEPDVQMELGDDYFAAGQLEKAEKAYANVLKQEDSNEEALKKLVEVKTALNSGYRENRNIIKLLDRLEKLTADEAELKNLDYQRIQLYSELGETEKAEELLKKYIEKPVFALESGTYPQDTLFEISSQAGTIYYTVDKERTPQEYTGPIMLKPGSRQVKAWVVDSSGVSGEKAEAFYFISAGEDLGADPLAAQAEKFINDTLYMSPLPEFSSPQRLTFDKLAPDVIVHVLKTRKEEPDLDTLGVPENSPIRQEVVVTAQEVEEMAQTYFGPDYQVNHRTYREWTYEEAYGLYHQPPTDWADTPMVYVQSVQEDTDGEGNPLLTVEAVMCTLTMGPGIYHPITKEQVLDTDWDVSDAQRREEVIANAQQLQTLTISLKQDGEGNLHYQSCEYTN